MPAQAPSAVVMVRPHHFRPNPATLADNSFQLTGAITSGGERRAHDEITHLAARLTERGVKVHLFEDTGHATPDSVFPNNWITSHSDGTVALYPMHADNRRLERRADVLEELREHYQVSRVLDLDQGTPRGVALEGTGAMVLDHLHRVAYVCRSLRADPTLLARFCAEMNYRAVVFSASDRNTDVYHTNVMMAVGTGVALIGAELIDDPAERRQVLTTLADSGREIITLSREQIRRFAGNCLELRGSAGPLLALSSTAARCLSDTQTARLSRHLELLPLDLPTIEAAGGSVRCTLAGIHLPATSPLRSHGITNDVAEQPYGAESVAT